MKKITLIGLLAVSLYAGGYYNSNSGYYNSNSNNGYYNSQPDRGTEKPGDDNYINQQQDEMIYGKRNAYQGSRAGDDDWGERNMKQLMGDY